MGGFVSTHFELDDLVESSKEMERFLQLSQYPKYHKLFDEFFKVQSDPDEAKKFREDMKRLRREIRSFASNETFEDVASSRPVDFEKKAVLSSAFQSRFYIVCHAIVYQDYSSTLVKRFIHVCENEQISAAHSVRLCASHGDHGHNHKHHKFHGKTDNIWEIPYASIPPIKVSDTKMYTLAFGSRTIGRSQRDDQFKSTLVLTALEIIEEDFSEKISRDDVTVVDALTFKQQFLPSSFTPPLLTYNFNAAQPLLLPSPPLTSGPGKPQIVIKDFSFLDESLRSRIPAMEKVSSAFLPIGWPPALPFRRIHCLGHRLQQSLPVTQEQSLNFLNFTADQSIQELSVIIDLSTARNRNKFELGLLQFEIFANADASKALITFGLSELGSDANAVFLSLEGSLSLSAFRFALSASNLVLRVEKTSHGIWKWV